MRRRINIELTEWLRENARNYTIDDLLVMVNKKFKETYTRLQLQKYLVRNKIEYKYKNKKNSHNMSRLPIGTEYTKKDGMVLVKIGRNKWEYKQRYIYEQYYGKIPKNMYVIFLDQNRSNYDINNLRAITRRESSIISNQKIFSKSKEVTETAIEVAKLIIKSRDVKINCNE